MEAVVDIGGDVVSVGGVCGGVTSRRRCDDDGVTPFVTPYEKASDDDEDDDGDEEGEADLRWPNDGSGDSWKTASPVCTGGDGSGVTSVDAWLFLW
jgi:hypothetical protein